MPCEYLDNENFSLNQLSEEADQAWENIQPWVQKRVKRATSGFRLDPQRIDDISSRIVAAIRKKAKSEPTAFAEFKKLGAYVRVAARRLAARAVKKAQPLVELTAAEAGGNEEVLSANLDKTTTENYGRKTEALLLRVEAWVARHRPARDLTILKLIRGGASGDEMASVLGVSRNAAYQARHRLEKNLRAVRCKLE